MTLRKTKPRFSPWMTYLNKIEITIADNTGTAICSCSWGTLSTADSGCASGWLRGSNVGGVEGGVIGAWACTATLSSRTALSDRRPLISEVSERFSTLKASFWKNGEKKINTLTFKPLCLFSVEKKRLGKKNGDHEHASFNINRKYCDTSSHKHHTGTVKCG